ncbi:MAG: hypothetical protein LBD07_03700 [Spirochaetaceae bacterium]|jgi:hypothetical protein|nr:hypothetical protein [Spirochaetaceae bacterium]
MKKFNVLYVLFVLVMTGCSVEGESTDDDGAVPAGAYAIMIGGDASGRITVKQYAYENDVVVFAFSEKPGSYLSTGSLNVKGKNGYVNISHVNGVKGKIQFIMPASSVMINGKFTAQDASNNCNLNLSTSDSECSLELVENGGVDYILTMPYEKTSANLDIEPQSSGGFCTWDSNNLSDINEGLSSMDITVTAQAGARKSFKVKIVRLPNTDIRAEINASDFSAISFSRADWNTAPAIPFYINNAPVTLKIDVCDTDNLSNIVILGIDDYHDLDTGSLTGNYSLQSGFNGSTSTDSRKIGTIRVTATKVWEGESFTGEKIYSLTLKRDAPAARPNGPLATGGTTSYIKRPNDPDWDEVHVFKTVGNTSFIVSNSLPADSVRMVLIGGGGGGGKSIGAQNASGGGGGGILIRNNAALPRGNYTIMVGAGGVGGALDNSSEPAGADKKQKVRTYNGQNSVMTGPSGFAALTAFGGGGGGWHGDGDGAPGADGGSGGGGYSNNGGGGISLSGQGNSGGAHWHDGTAGGGGYGSAGSNNGNGGVGIVKSAIPAMDGITGIPDEFAGGGAGGTGSASHGGGAQSDGTSFTGGGGGGYSGNHGFAGGSGIVVVRFRHGSSLQ